MVTVEYEASPPTAVTLVVPWMAPRPVLAELMLSAMVGVAPGAGSPFAARTSTTNGMPAGSKSAPPRMFWLVRASWGWVLKFRLQIPVTLVDGTAESRVSPSGGPSPSLAVAVEDQSPELAAQAASTVRVTVVD